MSGVSFRAIEMLAILPIGTIVILALIMLCLDLCKVWYPRLIWLLSTCALSFVSSIPQFFIKGSVFGGLLSVGAFNTFIYALLLGGAALALALNRGNMEAQRVSNSVDVDVLTLFAVAGAMVMVSSTQLMILFLGFELLSVSVYVLAGLARKEKASSEAALKYFILGAFSSAFLLYGIVLVYAATGSMEYVGVASQARADNLMLWLGFACMLFGFAFKLGVVPFHFWVPDVYQGAPTSITVFMAVVVKVAAFGSFFRVMVECFGPVSQQWVGLLWTLSVISMTVGNLVALRQKSIKRMLAYSSISHAGYALMGLLVPDGGQAMIFYLAVYSLMTVASFGVVLIVTKGTDRQYDRDDLDSLSGMGWSHPLLGLAMVVAMLSLAGMPPFAGFIGKLYLFRAAIQGGFVGLTIIAALNSVVSLYYYLRVLVVLYFRAEPSEAASKFPMPLASLLALAVATLGTLYLGVFSDRCFEYVITAVQSLG